MPIIISKHGKDAKKIEKSSFIDENYLQEYIHENPDAIPLYDIQEDIKLLVLAREYPTHSGPIDAIGIDYDGEIYIVETKLYKNADKRRVVAQALDYGAALWKHANNFSEFLSVMDIHAMKAWGIPMAKKIQDFFHISDEEVEDILARVERNLNDGKFRFVILMDQLDARLKDLILYVNQNSQFDIFAVEFSYYQYESYEIIIPKLFGAEVKKDISVKKAVSGSRRKWDEVSFLEEVANHVSDSISLETFYNFSKKYADKINWGTGAQTGSASIVVDAISSRSIYTLKSNGDVSINFGWMDETIAIPYRDKLAKLLVKNNFIEEVNSISKLWAIIPYEEWKEKAGELEQIFRELKR